MIFTKLSASKLAKNPLTLGIFSLSIMSFTASSASASVFFQGLGFLPDSTRSYVRGISNDGSVAVGYSGGFNPQAFRWQNGIMQELPVPFSNDGSSAEAVSADGSIVVGDVSTPLAGGGIYETGPLAVLWQNDTLKNLNDLTYYPSGSALNISSDGSVVVGYIQYPYDRLAVIWRNDAVEYLPSLSYNEYGEQDSIASAVSANGSTVVGSSVLFSEDGFYYVSDNAVRWQNGQIQQLPVLPGDIDSYASDVSANGNLIVGASGNSAVLWQGDEIQDLGVLPGGGNSSAVAISAHGSTVVGHSGNQAFIWNETLGIRSLQDILVNDFGLGASLTGWTLTNAVDVSADGLTIVGNGINPNGENEAWIARIEAQAIPEPLTLLGAATAIGWGSYFKRSTKRTKKNSPEKTF